MSEEKSTNDSAPGTFAFFETFQASGTDVPSLDAMPVSGEWPQLDQPVEVKEEVVEAVPEPVKQDVAVEEPVQAQTITEPEAVSVEAAEEEADDWEQEIDPVLQRPTPPVAPPAPEVVEPVVAEVAETSGVAKTAPVEDAVVEADEPVAEVEPVEKISPEVSATSATEEVTKQEAPAALTVEEIVAAAAARLNESNPDTSHSPEDVESTKSAETVAEIEETPVKESASQKTDSSEVVATSSPEPQATPPALSVEEIVAAATAQVKQSLASAEETAAAPAEVTPPVEEPKAKVEPAKTEAKDASSETSSENKSPSGKVRFADLPLTDDVKAAVQQTGYDTPTEIQAQIIPHMLDGRDVLAQSQTGTGKTAAFALPVLSRIESDRRETQVLVLAPTRELAMQVAESFETYGSEVGGFQVAAIYGGAGYEHQIRQLKRASVVVGTPGRVIDHIKRGTLRLSTLSCLVLDEADEMLNMGFLEDVEFVLEHTPETRQIALFSATMPGPIRNIADRYLNDPVKITVKQKTMTAEAIRQRAVFVPPRNKMEVLARFLEVEETDGVIVFARTREATATVADELNSRGLKAAALNGDMPQQVRERTVDQLKAGRLNILVATDVAARGLDVPRIRHVFNFDVPMDNESYIHRIGRTGRAGKKGEAILFVTGSQKNRLRSIERATRQPIEIVEAPTAAEVNEVRTRTFLQSISSTVESRDLSFFKQMLQDHAQETNADMIDVAAALADQLQQGRPFFAEDLPKTRRRENDRNRERNERGGRDRFERSDRGGRQDRRRQGGPPRGGMQRYRIEVGRADNVKPGNIVGAVANEGGLDGDQIGPISIYDDYSTVDLPDGMPQDVFQTLRKVRVAGKQLQLSRATPGDDQPKRRFGGKGKFNDRNSGGGNGGPGKRRFGGNRGQGGGGKGKSFGKKKFRQD